MYRLIALMAALLIAAPAMAEPANEGPVTGEMVMDEAAVAEPEATTTAGEDLAPVPEQPERTGPATATDRIVDRFMELNLNPEESAGVDFEEYFTMVMQRENREISIRACSPRIRSSLLRKSITK